MVGDYTPIKTNADRDVENVNAIKDAAHGLAKGFVNGLGQAVDRLVPQGRDELANALFNGSAYWPGEHPETPAQAETPTEGNAPSYDDVLNDAARRGGNDSGRGLSH